MPLSNSKNLKDVFITHTLLKGLSKHQIALVLKSGAERDNVWFHSFLPFFLSGLNENHPVSSFSLASEAMGFKCTGCAIERYWVWIPVPSSGILNEWLGPLVMKSITLTSGPDRKQWWYSASGESAHLSRASLPSLFSSKGIPVYLDRLSFSKDCNPADQHPYVNISSLYTARTWICLLGPVLCSEQL